MAHKQNKLEQQDDASLSAIVRFKYEGSAVKDGSFDTFELGNALLATATLFKDANALVNESGTQIVVRTKAFEKGSFEIIQKLQQIGDATIPILAGTSLTALANLLQVIGFSKDIGILQLLKLAKNRKPEIAKRDGATVLKFDRDEISVPDHVAHQFLNNGGRIKKSLELVVNPLKDAGIDELKVISDGKEVARVSKEDVASFQSNEHEEVVEKKEFTSVATLELHTCRFSASPNWVFIHKGKVIHALIKDEAFLGKVGERRYKFGHHESLMVELTEIIEPLGENLQVHYEIRKVIKVIRGAEQLPLIKQSARKKKGSRGK